MKNKERNMKKKKDGSEIEEKMNIWIWKLSYEITLKLKRVKKKKKKKKKEGSCVSCTYSQWLATPSPNKRAFTLHEWPILILMVWSLGLEEKNWPEYWNRGFTVSLWRHNLNLPKATPLIQTKNYHTSKGFFKD